jgi:hypothetical protein
MIIDEIKKLNQKIIDYNLGKKVVSYNENNDSDYIKVLYLKNNTVEIGKLIKTEYNLKLLADRIEKQALIEKEIALKTYEIGNKINKIAFWSLIFLNICEIGDLNLIVILLDILTVYIIRYQDKILENRLELEYYKQELIEKLKSGKVYLEEDEVDQLNMLPRIRYEFDGEVTIANINEVCPPKVLKKRIKK